MPKLKGPAEKLFRAIKNGNLSRINATLDDAPDCIYAVDEKGDSALHAAVNLLIKTAQDNERKIPFLDKVLRKCHRALDIIQLIAEMVQADVVNVKTQERPLTVLLEKMPEYANEETFMPVIQSLLTDQFMRQVDEEYGGTVLHRAIDKQWWNLALLLANNGAEVTRHYEDGRPMLHQVVAMSRCEPPPPLQLLKALSGRGMLDCQGLFETANGMTVHGTALHVAAALTNSSMISTLTDMRADTDSRNESGWTPAEEYIYRTDNYHHSNTELTDLIRLLSNDVRIDPMFLLKLLAKVSKVGNYQPSHMKDLLEVLAWHCMSVFDLEELVFTVNANEQIGANTDFQLLATEMKDGCCETTLITKYMTERTAKTFISILQLLPCSISVIYTEGPSYINNTLESQLPENIDNSTNFKEVPLLTDACYRTILQNINGGPTEKKVKSIYQLPTLMHRNIKRHTQELAADILQVLAPVTDNPQQ